MPSRGSLAPPRLSEQGTTVSPVNNVNPVAMPSLHTLERQANLMTDEEQHELIEKGWHPRVIVQLALRGFRPCKPDWMAARFEGASIDRTMGFLRQTSMPHIYITVERDELVEVVLERIDTAIYEAGRQQGHEVLAASFMSFFTRCQRVPPAADMSAIEKRLAAIEARQSDKETTGQGEPKS